MKRIRFAIALLALLFLMGMGQVARAADNAPLATVATSGPRLNVRQGPGLGYAVIAKATNGTVYPLLGRNAESSWLQIQYGEIESEFGWVSAAYVRTDAVLADLPISTAESGAPAYQHAPVTATNNPPTMTGQPAAAPQSPQPAKTGGNGAGLIVFQESSGGAIYVINADGTGLRFLTTGMDPALSPDRSQVAFGRWGEASGLYLINIDGSGERKVTPGAQIKYPAWSPDGSQIVFTQQIGGGGSTTVVLPWGTFTRVSPDDWRLVVVRPDGSGLQGVPDQPRSFSPSWTEEGILYAVKGRIQRTAPGDATAIVYDGNPPLRNPVLSPDGKTILATRFFAGHWEIARFDGDGSGLARLIPSKGSEHTVSATWSPDGSRILFLTDRTGEWELWVMNADGSNAQPFAPNALADIHFVYDFVAEHVADWR